MQSWTRPGREGCSGLALRMQPGRCSPAGEGAPRLPVLSREGVGVDPLARSSPDVGSQVQGG